VTTSLRVFVILTVSRIEYMITNLRYVFKFIQSQSLPSKFRVPNSNRSIVLTWLQIAMKGDNPFVTTSISFSITLPGIRYSLWLHFSLTIRHHHILQGFVVTRYLFRSQDSVIEPKPYTYFQSIVYYKDLSVHDRFTSQLAHTPCWTCLKSTSEKQEGLYYVSWFTISHRPSLTRSPTTRDSFPSNICQSTNFLGCLLVVRIQ
jgi:hypothetical protein